MRETRLLILVVVVSVAVLLLLARFRFPDTRLANVAPSAGPLAGLAARATFDEMAAAMSRVLTQVAPTVALVRFDPHATPAPEKERPGAQVKAAAVAPPGPSLVFPGIRVQPDVALVYLPRDHHPVSTPDLTDPVQVLVSDPTRQFALVRTVPSPLSLDGLPAPVRNLGGFSYVANVRPALNGPTVQPVFIGRTVPGLNDMLALPSAAVGIDSGLPTGSLVFTLDGRFIGIAVPVPGDTATAIVSGEALVELARRWLAAGSPVP